MMVPNQQSSSSGSESSYYDSEEDQNSVKNDPQRENFDQPVMLTDEQQESAEIHH